MLSEKGGQALIEFTAKTNTVIVTFGMPEEGLERLDIMLVDWQGQPSVEKEFAITDEFAVTEDRNDPTRIPDAY